jgi:hypothetical protein
MNAFAPARIVQAGDGVAVGEASNVCIVVWRGAVTWPRFEVQRDGLAEVIRQHPKGVGFLCVIEPTAAPPDDALRRASADMVVRHHAELRCIACVVEGVGFRNAVARSALSAMSLLMRSRTAPLSVFGAVDAAATWMLRHVDTREAAGLVRAVEAVRATL